METTIDLVKKLVNAGIWRISDHAAEEMDEDAILPTDLLGGVQSGEVVEDYPAYAKGPCVLVLQTDSTGKSIHVLWGIPAVASEPAVVITAYRPDPTRWSADFRRRLS